jgi:hypothetical protein
MVEKCQEVKAANHHAMLLPGSFGTRRKCCHQAVAVRIAAEPVMVAARPQIKQPRTG